MGGIGSSSEWIIGSSFNSSSALYPVLSLCESSSSSAASVLVRSIECGLECDVVVTGRNGVRFCVFFAAL